MEIKVDSDVQSVLEFMQREIPTAKLTAVAEALPKMARLLWPQSPEESMVAVSLFLPKTGPTDPLPASAI